MLLRSFAPGVTLFSKLLYEKAYFLQQFVYAVDCDGVCANQRLPGRIRPDEQGYHQPAGGDPGDRFDPGANPEAQLEVVIYGQGLDLAVRGRSAQEGAVQKLIADGKAKFKVCAMTMKRNNIDKDQLVTGVEVVPDGIYELLSKQREGWGYIKVAH